MRTAKRSTSASGRGCSPPWWMALAVCLALGVALPGCGGCGVLPKSKQAQGQKAKKKSRKKLVKKAKPKPDFESVRFVTYPSQTGRSDVFVKPGHWTSGAISLRANNFEFRGGLESGLTDAGGRPQPLPDTRFLLRIERPLVLPKAQKRNIELPVYLPENVGFPRTRHRVLNPRGSTVHEDMSPLVRMPAHQFFFVVLARNPSAYQYLNRLPCVLAPGQELIESSVTRHYQVVLPAKERRVPLPATSLEWTAIAYLLWDNFDPARLDRGQQTALLDWLHWGGQLLVSGPESLDLLRGSFLEPYLPCSGQEVWELHGGDLANLQQPHWLKTHPPLVMRRPWRAVRLLPVADAEVTLQTLQGEPLLVEHRVGAGRVLVSAFRLGQRELVDWKHTDVLYNALLLRRPPRHFVLGSDGAFAVFWTDHTLYDPRVVSRLSYFTRDSKLVPGLFESEVYAEAPTPLVQQNPYGSSMGRDQSPPYGAGVAGWNDFSAASKLGRRIVTEASGIDVPDASFVLWFLGVYLAVLVGLNWLFFKSIGRVEWAWGAVPVIALVGGVAVIRLAQVNIGFDRSQTELDIVELQAGYERAHVTRYLALYSSLGTRYDLRFDEPTALALPAARGAAGGRAVTQGTSEVTLRRVREVAENGDVSEVRFSGLDVFSNSAELVHCEQMFELEGPLTLDVLAGGKLRLANHTGLVLRGAGIVAADQAAWLGTIRPGQTVEAVLEPRRDLRELSEAGRPGQAAQQEAQQQQTPRPRAILGLWSEHLEQHEATQLAPARGALNVRRLYLQAANDIPHGELRLLAWVDGGVPGLKVQPRARTRQITFLVAHLRPPPLPTPRPDASEIPDVRPAEEELP